MFATVEQVKNYLNITTNEDDDFITLLIKSAQDIIETYCKRKFSNDEYTETGMIKNNIIITKQYPITNILSLKINNVEISDFDLFDTYIATNENGKYEINYEAGYDNVDIPQALKFAAIKLASYLYKEAREDRLGITQEKIDVLTYNYSATVPQDILNTLKPYKKVNI